MIPDIREVSDLDRLIPAHLRTAVKLGEAPAYRVTKPDLDRLPLDTFLIDTVMGTMGLVPQRAIRIVKPRSTSSYPREKLTAHGRLLYVFWQLGKSRGAACRILADAKSEVYRHIVLPCDPRYAQLDAFKIACDTVRAGGTGAMPMKNKLLIKALGIVYPDGWSMIDVG